MGSGYTVTKRVFVASLLLALLCAASLAPSAGASRRGLTCGAQQTERPFLRWLDPLTYSLVPGGNFESGADGWKLSGGATVVAGNESFFVGSPADRFSLALPSGSSATSPAVCVNSLDAVMRFFLLNTGSPDSKLRVEVIYRTVLGLRATHQVVLSPLDGSRSWQPSPPLLFLADLTGLLSLNGLTTDVQFRFSPTGWGGGWRIDDVYVDPLVYV